jgi:hypothetical protein
MRGLLASVMRAVGGSRLLRWPVNYNCSRIYPPLSQALQMTFGEVGQSEWGATVTAASTAQK